MGSPFLPWIAFGIALALAAFLFLRVRSGQTRGAELEAERERLEGCLREAEKRAEAKTREQRRKGDELAELRRKLDKTRKRAARAADDQRGETDRVRELEESLRLARADRREALSRLEELEGGEAPRPAPPAPAPAPAPQAAAPVAAPTTEQLEALKALVERAERAEGRAAAVEDELRTASREAAKHRKRSRALDAAYAAQRGELEVKKDRLRAQQEELERLRALRAGLAARGPEPDAPEAPGPQAAGSEDA